MDCGTFAEFRFQHLQLRGSLRRLLCFAIVPNIKGVRVGARAYILLCVATTGEQRRGVAGNLAAAPQRVFVTEAEMMAGKRPTTIAEYIRAAPPKGRPHLRHIYTLLKQVAPDAQEAIKWGTPFFVEPRFLFAFSAHKAHLSFAPMAAAMVVFREELKSHKTTMNFLKVPYDQPLPNDLIRRIAEHCVHTLRERKDDAFW